MIYNGDLILVRGVSGSGKTTLAEALAVYSDGTVNSADNYFYNANGEYNWEARLLPMVHAKCLEQTAKDMALGISPIFVANTFASERDFRPYIEESAKYNYRVFTIIVENRHGSENIHDVPNSSLEKQKRRFNIKL